MHVNTVVTVGYVDIETGTDMSLEGANINATGLTAKIGGGLTITSLQDQSTYTSRDSSFSLGANMPIYGNVADAKVNVGLMQSDIDYYKKTVNTQSGLNVGEDGFEIEVEGHTALTAALIQADDKAIQDGKVKLTTKTLTTADLQNEVSIEASSSGFSLSTDMATQGKYGAVKAIIGNTLLNGEASDSDYTWTHTALSEGEYAITDDAAQLELTGKTAAKTIAELNHDVAHAHTALKDINISAISNEAQANQAIKQEFYEIMVPHADAAYDSVLQNAFYSVIKDEKGLIHHQELTNEEKQNLEAASDGKVHVATNGIFNDIDEAAKHVMKHSSSDGAQYLVYFETARTGLAELLVAGYQKFFENDFWGYSGPAKEIDEVIKEYGDNLHLDAHSRGSMTIGNQFESYIKDPNSKGMLSGTTVTFFGPAYNAAEADKMLSQLQDRDSIEDPEQRKKMELKLENHFVDPIGRFVGGNPGTMGSLPEGMSTWKAGWQALFGKYTVHNCYGYVPDEICGKYR